LEKFTPFFPMFGNFSADFSKPWKLLHGGLLDFSQHWKNWMKSFQGLENLPGNAIDRFGGG